MRNPFLTVKYFIDFNLIVEFGNRTAYQLILFCDSQQLVIHVHVCLFGQLIMLGAQVASRAPPISCLVHPGVQWLGSNQLAL